MMNFIEKANLPKGDVKSLICGCNDKSVLDFFNKKDIKVYKNEINPNIDKAINFHADIVAIHLEKNTIFLDKQQKELKEELSKNGFVVYETEKEIKGAYPEDVKLNFSIVDDCVTGNFNHADKNFLKLISDKRKINVNQGYCRCSMLILNESAIITDDTSIHNKMLKNGFDSLLISKGDIYLQGHEYGFIGGACGKISKNTIVFFGDIKMHHDFEIIEKFLLKHGCEYLCSDNDKLRDIGGIITLTEEI